MAGGVDTPEEDEDEVSFSFSFWLWFFRWVREGRVERKIGLGLDESRRLGCDGKEKSALS